MADVAVKDQRVSDGGTMQVEEFRNLVDGEWFNSVSKPFDNLNPADTSDIVGRFQTATTADAPSAEAVPVPPMPIARADCSGSAKPAANAGAATRTPSAQSLTASPNRPRRSAPGSPGSPTRRP